MGIKRVDIIRFTVKKICFKRGVKIGNHKSKHSESLKIQANRLVT